MTRVNKWSKNPLWNVQGTLEKHNGELMSKLKVRYTLNKKVEKKNVIRTDLRK